MHRESPRLGLGEPIEKQLAAGRSQIDRSHVRDARCSQASLPEELDPALAAEAMARLAAYGTWTS